MPSRFNGIRLAAAVKNRRGVIVATPVSIMRVMLVVELSIQILVLEFEFC